MFAGVFFNAKMERRVYLHFYFNITYVLMESFKSGMQSFLLDKNETSSAGDT